MSLSKSKMRPLAPFLAVDHAARSLASREYEQVLRWALPALADDFSRAAAADLAGRALHALKRTDLARNAWELSVAWCLQQNLGAQAVASALAFQEATRDEGLLRTVAKALNASAPHDDTVQAKPPALKRESLVPLDAALAGEKLLSESARLLSATPKPTAKRVPQPRLPLWGSLPENAFVAFAKALSVETLDGNVQVMREGDRGDRAYIVVRGEVRVWRTDIDPSEPNEAQEYELAVLGPGSIVGEMALVTDAPRAATVTTTRATLLLCAPREALDQVARDVASVAEHVAAFCRRRLIDNVLRTSPLLREIPASEREGLATMFEAQPFEKGNVLIKQGHSGTALHVIAVGRANVVRKDEKGDVSQLARLGAGTVAGEISLVMRRPANASVVAAGSGVSLVLSPERFREAIKGRPHLLAQLYELAVQREDEMLSVIAQEAVDADDIVIV